ncbi:hypothetical protein AB0F15_03480 [Amycolatopsis sp. NPDC026612]
MDLTELDVRRFAAGAARAELTIVRGPIARSFNDLAVSAPWL